MTEPFVIRLMAALLLIAPWLSMPARAATALPPAFFATHGIEVLSSEPAPGGMTAWHVRRNGAQTVLFTSADNRVVLSGVLWDAGTGANLSDAFYTASETRGQGPANIDISQFSPDKVPSAIQAVSKLKGVKEGSATVDKTLYVMFDPLCSHCHNLYRMTRDFVAHGGSIYWIPVTVFGGARSEPYVERIMQASDTKAELGKIMGGSSAPLSLPLSPASKQLLAENKAYFWSAFDSNKAAGVPGVPVAFYASADGVPQMVGGVDDKAVLQDIVARMKR